MNYDKDLVVILAPTLRRPWNPAQNPGYFSSQSWLPTPGLRVAGDRPTGGAHGSLKSAAGRAAGNELRTRKEHVSNRDAGFKQPLERCNLLTHWAFEYFDQTTSTFTMTPDHVIHSPRNGQSWQV